MKPNAFFLMLFTCGLAWGQDVDDLQPFTHVAHIPAGSDQSSIRFEGVKLVQLATKIAYTKASKYCEELAARDLVGSMPCSYARPQSPVAAYQVTYSYNGVPLASDETANRYFTFQVYFRQDELPAAAKTHFSVNVQRDPVQRTVIDEDHSRFCNGNYADGVWTHNDRTCQDEIATKEITRPADYLTITVDAARLLSANK